MCVPKALEVLPTRIIHVVYDGSLINVACPSERSSGTRIIRVFGRELLADQPCFFIGSLLICWLIERVGRPFDSGRGSGAFRKRLGGVESFSVPQDYSTGDGHFECPRLGDLHPETDSKSAWRRSASSNFGRIGVSQ